MSYGIGLVILKEDLEQSRIRYANCDWTLPITVKIYPKDCKRSFRRWWVEMQKDAKFTTKKKLLQAPCDCVCIIDKDGEFSILEGHKPMNCGKSAPIKNQYWGIHFTEYLTVGVDQTIQKKLSKAK